MPKTSGVPFSGAAKDDLKNTKAGDGYQGRILLRGDVFRNGLSSLDPFAKMFFSTIFGGE